jgi:hypothetical protein
MKCCDKNNIIYIYIYIYIFLSLLSYKFGGQICHLLIKDTHLICLEVLHGQRTTSFIPKAIKTKLERINLIDQEQDERERERERARERGFCEKEEGLCVWEKSWWLNLSVRDGVGIGAGGSTHTPQST